jgi:hypothetical protein
MWREEENVNKVVGVCLIVLREAKKMEMANKLDSDTFRSLFNFYLFFFLKENHKRMF